MAELARSGWDGGMYGKNTVESSLSSLDGGMYGINPVELG